MARTSTSGKKARGRGLPAIAAIFILLGLILLILPLSGMSAQLYDQQQPVREKFPERVKLQMYPGDSIVGSFSSEGSVSVHFYSAADASNSSDWQLLNKAATEGKFNATADSEGIWYLAFVTTSGTAFDVVYSIEYHSQMLNMSLLIAGIALICIGGLAFSIHSLRAPAPRGFGSSYGSSRASPYGYARPGGDPSSRFERMAEQPVFQKVPDQFEKVQGDAPAQRARFIQLEDE